MEWLDGGEGGEVLFGIREKEGIKVGRITVFIIYN